MNTTITDACYRYFTSFTKKETPVQQRLCERIRALSAPMMQIDPLQGQFLAFLVKALNAKHILEIGTFLGYSSLWLAHALPKDGKLITCDVNEIWAGIASVAFEDDGVAHKIEQIVQPAEQTLNEFLCMSPRPLFDLIFIDADKISYATYVDKTLSLLSPNGVIIVDNVWWHGDVVDETNQIKSTRALREFNQAIAQDPRIEMCMLPLGDGMTFIRKNST